MRFIANINSVVSDVSMTDPETLTNILSSL